MGKPQARQDWRFYFTQIFLPVGIWALLFFTRPWTYSLKCTQSAEACTSHTFFALDQLAFHHKSVWHDALSNTIQNSLGVVIFLFPFLLWVCVKFVSKYAPFYSFRQARSDFALLLSATLWNAAFLEGVRLVVQRPRPGVIDNPMTEGLNPYQYTSFYSGHTSFVALASFSVFFILMRFFKRARLSKKATTTYTHAQKYMLTFVLVLSLAATTLTGVLRVMGGRHYPTDTLVGALVGFGIAWLIQAKPHQKQWVRSVS